MIIVEMSISSFNFVRFCFIYFDRLSSGAQIFVIVTFSCCIETFKYMTYFLYLVVFYNLKFILLILIQLSLLSLVTICMEFLFLSLWLFVSLDLKWISCTPHMGESCFYIHPANLCLLIGEFNSFTFKVILVRKKWLSSFCYLFSLCCIAFLSLISCITASLGI